MRINIFSSRVFGLAVCLLAGLGLLSPIALPVFASDTAPPYLVCPVPEPDSANNPQFITVKVGIVDDLSPINSATILMLINGSAPIVEPIIEPSYHDRGYNLYYELHEVFDPGTIITISIEADDKPQDGSTPNHLSDSWQFSIGNMTFFENLLPVYPPDHSWLDYDWEKHLVRFMWTPGRASKFYRLNLLTESGISGSIDFGPGDYVDSLQMGLISVSFDFASPANWELLHTAGELEWKVAPIDEMGGQLLAGYSSIQSARYIHGQIPLLDTPVHQAMLDPETPPYFSWETLPNVTGYYLFLIKLDDNDHMTDEVFFGFLPYFFNSYEVDMSNWNMLSSGNWCWTVAATFTGDLYSDYVFNFFRKLEK
jgi:hypothetical protein